MPTDRRAGSQEADATACNYTCAACRSESDDSGWFVGKQETDNSSSDFRIARDRGVIQCVLGNVDSTKHAARVSSISQGEN